MRTYESPYISDWFVISLRWLIIVGLAISLAIGNQLFQFHNLLLGGLIAWNLSLTFIAGFNRRLQNHRKLSLGIDLGVAILFFWLQGGLSSSTFWIVILPIFSAAMYYELKGAMIAGAGMILLQLLYTLVNKPGPSDYSLLAYEAVATLAISYAFGFLGKRIMDQLRKLYQDAIDSMQKKGRIENERLRAIYNMTSSLVGTLNYQKVLKTVLDVSASALAPEGDPRAVDRSVSAVLLFSKGGDLEVATARGFTATDLRKILPCQGGVLLKTVEDGEPILADNIPLDPELSLFVTLHSCRKVYCFPLRTGFNVYGILIFGHPDKNYFTRDRLDILDILSRQSVIAIQNAILYQDITDERDRVVEIHDKARKKLARDLHDGPTQSISGIAMRISLARKMLNRNVHQAAEEMERIEDLAHRTTKEMRHMLFTLRPLVLESQGLKAALQTSAEKMKETYGQDVYIEVDKPLADNLEMGKQGVIFSLVEESLTNARKHANATHIWVRLRLVEQEIALLEVQDNGVGFDLQEINRAYDERGSLGMINLHERTDLLNGHLNIISTPGKGTRVQVYIPLNEEAADRMHRALGNHKLPMKGR
ncbi:histidine kinase [Chloroflexota bacterium]